MRSSFISDTVSYEGLQTIEGTPETPETPARRVSARSEGAQNRSEIFHGGAQFTTSDRSFSCAGDGALTQRPWRTRPAG